MELHRTPPEDVIEPSWLEDYLKQVEALWSQVTTLNTHIYLLNKIDRFPFNVLFDPNQVTFWATIYYALFDASILLVWKIAVDSHGDFLTLKSLMNEIYQHLKRDGKYSHQDLKDALSASLHAIRFRKTIKGVEDTVRDLRHTYIAHFNRDRVTGVTPRISNPLPLEKIEQVKDAIIRQFEVLTFGQSFSYLPRQYDHTVGQIKSRAKLTDIENMLIELASKSLILREPEENPHLWPHRRRRMTDEEIQDFNYYRKQLGLPPAPEEAT